MQQSAAHKIYNRPIISPKHHQCFTFFVLWTHRHFGFLPPVKIIDFTYTLLVYARSLFSQRITVCDWLVDRCPEKELH